MNDRIGYIWYQLSFTKITSRDSMTYNYCTYANNTNICSIYSRLRSVLTAVLKILKNSVNAYIFP